MGKSYTTSHRGILHMLEIFLFQCLHELHEAKNNQLSIFTVLQGAETKYEKSCC